MAFALITGGSGGIGLCLARELASRKHDILLVARSSDQLSKICAELRKEFGINAEFLSLDLSVTDAHLKVKSWVDERSFSVDILINNAGYGIWSPFEKSNPQELANRSRKRRCHRSRNVRDIWSMNGFIM